jgi:hypothetical protein
MVHILNDNEKVQLRPARISSIAITKRKKKSDFFIAKCHKNKLNKKNQ